MKNRYGNLFLTVMVSAFLVFGISGTGLADSHMMKIGVAGPHSGDLASYGIPTVNAVEIMVEKRNAMGGVLGKKIELAMEDDVCKPEVAANTASKLASQQVDCRHGSHLFSGPPRPPWESYQGVQDLRHVSVGHQSEADPERRLSQLLPHHRLRRCPGASRSGLRPG
jgi:hypothetical protein